MSTCNILDHLYATYANVLPSGLQEKETRFRAPYDSNQPIENLINHVETAVEYSAAGNRPYSPAQVVVTACQIIFQTGLFNDDFKVCKRKAEAYKTWKNFKVDFATAHQEWQESQAISAGGAGFQSTNLAHQQETLDSFASLSASTTSNRSAIAELTVTNNTLAADCTTTHALLVTAFWFLTKLQASVANFKRQLSTISSVRSHRNNYFHNCGQRCDFPSKRCPKPITIHQHDATSAERKVGTSKTYKPST